MVHIHPDRELRETRECEREETRGETEIKEGNGNLNTDFAHSEQVCEFTSENISSFDQLTDHGEDSFATMAGTGMTESKRCKGSLTPRMAGSFGT